jgi:uncharacterized protein
MTKSFHIARDLSLPIEAAETTWAILGKKGSGKSTTAVDLVEEILKHAQIPVAVLDPTGVWWGLQSTAAGDTKGFPVTIFGGEHKNLPLEAPAGELMADLVAEDRVSCVFDLSGFGVRELQRFAYDFLTRLYAKNRHAMFLVLDEADDFAPQVIRGGEKGGYAERMLGACERLVKQGRVRGIAPCFITQRPASLNKNVLSQIDSLVVMRLMAPQDRDAIKEWVKYNGTAEQLAEMQVDLATLDTSTGYIWSPEALGLFRKVKFRASETFDSRRKPRAGMQIAPPKVLAPVDLKKLEHKMAALIDRAKAEDPRELRAEIARLKKEASKGAARFSTSNEVAKHATDQVAVARAVEAAVQKREREFEHSIKPMRNAIQALLTDREQHARKLRDFVENDLGRLKVLWELLNGIKIYRPAEEYATVQTNGKPLKPETAGALATLAALARDFPPNHQNEPCTSRATGLAGANLPKGEKAVGAALAQYPKGLRREQLTVITGYKKSSRDAYIARLKDRGHIDVLPDGRIVAFESLIAALGANYEPPLVGEKRREQYLRDLPFGESRVLALAIENYPQWIARDTVTETTGYKKSSRDAYIARLKARELI